MNVWFRPLLLTAVWFWSSVAGSAQPPAAPAEPKAPSTAPAPADAATAQNPPPTQPAATSEAAPAPQPPAAESRDTLRRIDDVDPQEPGDVQVRRSYRRGGSEFPFGDHTVSKDRRMHDLVSILGSSTVEGTVDSDAVSVAGDTTILRGGNVNGAAVAVLGRLESQGTIKREAVSVLGGSKIDGYVGGEAVSVLGNMHLGPNAVVEGDLVVVGGKLTKDPGAVVHGNEVRVPVLGGFGSMDWLTTWVKRCLLYGRPLAFGQNLGWAWMVAFSFFAFYLLLSLLFPKGIVKCAETLETRPGYSVLSSVLTVLLTPVVTVLLAITVVGALLVPFLGAGLFFAGLFGKAVMLAWIGRRFTKFFGDGPLGAPVFAVLIGGFIVLMIYTVPAVGFLSYKLLSWLGLGVVVYTVARGMKRDRPLPPPKPVAPIPPPSPVVPPPVSAAATPMTPVPEPSAPAATAIPLTSAGFTGSSAIPDLPRVPDAGVVPEPPLVAAESTGFAPPVPPVPPPPPTAPLPPIPPMRTPPPQPAMEAAWPRAGFFLRLGALALDGVLIGLILAMLSGMLPSRAHLLHNGPGSWLIALAIYGAMMWKFKGTTVGGIICGLKVVRVDNRELDWPTAVVRALGCFLSLAVAGLGFIWVAIDDDRQSWHDKIAGTAVVVVPKGVSLV